MDCEEIQVYLFSHTGANLCTVLLCEKRSSQNAKAVRHKTNDQSSTSAAVTFFQRDFLIVSKAVYKSVWLNDESLDEEDITNQAWICLIAVFLREVFSCVSVYTQTVLNSVWQQRSEDQNTHFLSLAVHCITQTFSILSAQAASTLAPSKLSRHFIKWLQTLGRVGGKSLY